MKNIYLVLIVFFGLQLNAQISTDPVTLEKTIGLTEEYVYHITVKNEGTSTASLHWLITKGSDIPAPWRIYLCDINLCYGPGTLSNNPTKPNVIPANSEVEFTLHVDPLEIEGAGTFSLKLFSDSNQSNLVWETEPTGVISASQASSVYSTSRDELSVYPNPADNFFSLKNNSGVAKLALFNIIGREVKRFNNVTANFFDISDLNKGMYLVRATDSKGKIIKTVRLSKR